MTNLATPPNAHDIAMVQAMADLQMALSAIDFMDEADADQGLSRIERRRLRCYEDAAVISYWRPFAGSKGVPQLEFKHFGIEPTPEQLALHAWLRDRRNKVVAHTDLDRMRLALSTMKVFDDSDIMLPLMDFDDGLAFFNDRAELIVWLRALIQGAARKTFRRFQGHGELRIVRDHLTTDGDAADR
jgi:hypothetical protein